MGWHACLAFSVQCMANCTHHRHRCGWGCLLWRGVKLLYAITAAHSVTHSVLPWHGTSWSSPKAESFLQLFFSSFDGDCLLRRAHPAKCQTPRLRRSLSPNLSPRHTRRRRRRRRQPPPRRSRRSDSTNHFFSLLLPCNSRRATIAASSSSVTSPLFRFQPANTISALKRLHFKSALINQNSSVATPLFGYRSFVSQCETPGADN